MRYYKQKFLPNRPTAFWQWRAGAEAAAAEVAYAVEIAAGAGEEAVLFGEAGVVEAVVRAACAAVHFHALPAQRAKFVKQVAPRGGG